MVIDRAVWDELANFESHEIVRQHMRQRHGRHPGGGLSREISAAFTHGRSYFMSAASAERTVKPLLLYYGVVSLARGLTMILTGQREATLAQAHGISQSSWREILSSDKRDYGALGVTFCRGTFWDLYSATANESLIYHAGVQDINRVRHPALPADSSLTLGQLIDRIPALQRHSVRWRSETKCAWVLHDEPSASGPRLRVPTHNQPVARGLADELACVGFHFTAEQETFLEYTAHADAAAIYRVEPTVGNGDVWAAVRYDKNAELSSLLTVFALSFILGTLVRYYPSQWTSLIHSHVGDAALPTLLASTEFVESEFPRLVDSFVSEELP